MNILKATLITFTLAAFGLAVIAQDLPEGTYMLSIEKSKETDGNKNVNKSINMDEFDSFTDVEDALSNQLDKATTKAVIADMKENFIEGEKYSYTTAQDGADVTVTFSEGHDSDMVFHDEDGGEHRFIIKRNGQWDTEDGHQYEMDIEGGKKRIKLRKSGDDEVVILDGHSPRIDRFTFKGNGSPGALQLYSDAAAGDNKPYLGVVIEPFDYRSVKKKHPKGVLVSSVMKGEAGYNAGLEEGDVITSVNGVKTPSPSLFKKAVSELEVGSDISLEYYRNGKKTVESTMVGETNGMDFYFGGDSFPQGLLNDLPMMSGDNNFVLFGNGKPMLGVSGEAVSQGLQVISVTSNSAAEKIGIQEGDIITSFGGKKVKDIDQLADLVAEHEAGDEVKVEYLKDGKKVKETATLGSNNIFDMSNIDMNFNNMDFENLFDLDQLKELEGQNFNFEQMFNQEGLKEQMEMLKNQLKELEQRLKKEEKSNKKDMSNS